MKSMWRQFSLMAVTASLVAGSNVAPTHAQFARTGYNPYTANNSGPSTPASGWNSIATPGNTSMYVGTSGAVFPQTSLYGSPAWGSFSMNLMTGMPFFNYGPTFLPPARSSYGGIRSSSQCSTTSSYAPPARVERSVKAFDRWVLDQQRTVPQEDVQKLQRSDDLQRSLNNPTAIDISSGFALNCILQSLNSMPEKVKATKPVPVDESLVKQISFTHGAGSSGLLRNEGKLLWPDLLLHMGPADEFAPVRGQIETQFQKAYKDIAAGGRADAQNITSLLKLVEQLSDMASGRASTMTFAENLEVKRYLRSLEDAVNFMKQPDANEWLPGKQKSNVKSVQELVQVMGEKHLRFAPALVGSDNAYSQMRRLLTSVHLEAAR